MILDVSIHAPPRGRDGVLIGQIASAALFQSTRPREGATLPRGPRHDIGRVSIHAPPRGRDAWKPS